MSENTEVTVEQIDEGSALEKVVEFQGKTFVAHRLTIEERLKVARLKVQRAGGVKLDEFPDYLAEMAAWCDVTLDPNKNPEWKGSQSIYNPDYIVGLYNKLWEAIEKPFFRPLAGRVETKAGAGENK